MTRRPGLRPALPGMLIACLLSACALQAPQKPAPVVLQPQGKPPAPQAPVLSPRTAANVEQLQRMAALQERLYRIAGPLLISNADLCRNDARNLLGFDAKNRYSYPADMAEAAQVAFGMGDRMQVTDVLLGSGAARAGLRRGDVLASVAGTPLAAGESALRSMRSILGPLVGSQSSIEFRIEREGNARNLTVPVTRACGYAIEVGNADNVNAYADGRRVMITRGMIQFTQNDNELAYVMAKTMAHNVLDHAAAQRNAATIESIIDNLVRVVPDNSLLIGSGGIKPMSGEADVAADTLALYMVARAGFGVDRASAFWQRLASTHPAKVLNDYVANHPATAARIAAIERTATEIKAKQSARKPLLP